MALAILRGKVPKMRSETEVRYRAFEVRPSVYWDVFEQDETASINEFEFELGEERAECGEWELILALVGVRATPEMSHLGYTR